MKLGFADIDGVHFLRTMLKKAIGEAARGGTHIDTDFSLCREEGKSCEGFFEFESAASNEAFGLTDAKNGLDGVLVSGLCSGDVIHKNFARQNESLSFFAAFG